MSELSEINRRVTVLEEWKNNQAVNSALIKQHAEHMDKRILDHAKHMDRRFNEHAALVEKQITEHSTLVGKQITAMSGNFKKINGWFSKFVLSVMIAVAVGVVQWIMAGGMM